MCMFFFFFSSRRRHTRLQGDWSSDVCSSDLSRIKVLSNLDIAEKRQPQDGRLKIDIAGRRIDMRVSTLPVTNGEKVVIRVIDTSRAVVALPEMGMQKDDLDRLKGYLERPQGIVLV